MAPGIDVELESVADRRGHGQADDAAGVAHHEVDSVRCRLLGGDHEVALVLAVFVIDEDDHAAVAQLGDGVIDGANALVASDMALSMSIL